MKQRLLAATMAAVMVLGGCSGGGQTAQTTASESKETTAAKETAEESKKEETSIAENTEVIEIDVYKRQGVRGSMVKKIQKSGNAVWKMFLDCLYPRRCPVCGEIAMPKGALICPDCEKKISWVDGPV